MPYSNPITQNELQDLALYNPLHPRDGSPAEQYMPQAYFLVPPATQAGPVKWRLFDAAYITTGIIDPNRLGTGATGAGNLYLADDGTWKPVAGGGGGGDMYKATYDVDNDGTVDSAERIEIIVRNSTGTTLTKGTVVYLSGATGNRPNAVRAQANSETTSSKTFGIVVADINNNSDGYVACNGTLHDLDTSAFADGAAVWLSATTAGAYTSTIPAEPNHTVFIGYVARSHPTQGRLVILIQNGYELNELHGVLISSEANNDLLTYESSTGLWKNKTISTIFGGTPLTSVPTLAQVTTAGNTTTNAIIINGNTITPNGSGHKVVLSAGSDAITRMYFDSTATGANWNAGMSISASSVPKWTIAGYGSTYDFTFYNEGLNLPGLFIKGSNNNVIIGASTWNPTDAGYKLDVNGTMRSVGLITAPGGISTVGGGIRIGDSTAGAIFYDASNRIYNNTYYGWVIYGWSYNHLAATNGLLISNSTSSTKENNTFLSVAGSITASSAIARGVYFNNTLVAAANNDVLVGLAINPTFNNGAFTGVSNEVIRANVTTSTAGTAWYYFINNTNGNSRSIFVIDNSANGFNGGTIALRAYGTSYNETLGGVNLVGGATMLINANGYNGPGLFLNNGIGSNAFLAFSVKVGEGFRIHSTTNVGIGTTTDSGHKLRVNGTVSAVLSAATHTSQVYYNTTTGELTYGALPTPATPTLDAVTTAGNTTTNAITVGGLNLGTNIQLTSSSAYSLNYITFTALTAGQGLSASFIPNGTPTGYAYNFQFGKSSTANNNSLLFIGGGSSAGAAANKHLITTSTDGTATAQPLAFAVATGNWNSATPLMTLTPTQNVLIGTTTDSGFKLDVVGTARVSGNLTVDTNTLFVDSANDRVGIGSTTFPSVAGVAKLYVEGSGSGVSGRTYFILKNTNASSAAAFSLINASGKILGAQINGSGWPGGEAGGFNTEYGLNMAFTTDGHLSSGGTSTIGFYVGGYAVSPTMTITAGNTGNVLIGTTTNAGYKLDVAGTARIQNNLLVNGPSTFTDRIYLGDSGADTDTNYYIQSGGQVYIQANAFRANNFYTDLVLMSGTTSVSQIQIRGNDDSSGFIRFTVNNAEAARFFNNGDLAIGTTSDDGYKLNVNGVIAATGGTSTNWNTAYSWGNHATAGYLTSQPWVTSGSNIYYNTGNVGIGTTNPTLGKLHVEGTVYSSRYELALGADLASGDKGLRVQDNFGGTYQYNNSGPYTGHFTYYHIRNTSAATMFYATSSAFGIGTTSPTARVHITGGSANWNETTPGTSTGTIHLDPETANNDFGNAITFGASDWDNGNNAQAGIYVRSDGNYGTKMYFATTDAYLTGSKTRMYIGETGNVGIGTTSPSQQLHVTGKVLIGAVDNFGDGNTKLYVHSPTNSVNIVLNPRPTAGDIYYRVKIGVDVNSNGSFYVDHEGSRIIEAWNSGGFLNLASVVSLGNKAWTLETNGYGLQMYSPYGWSSVVRYTNAATGTTATDGAFTGITENGDFRVWTYESHPMLFATANVERLRITNTGNVGIGTLTPSYKLDVSGDIRSTTHIIASGNLKSMYQSGDEGGEITLNKPATNTTLNTGVTIDVYQDKLRIFESGDTNRGGFFDLSALASGVGTNFAPVGYTGILNIPGNFPGQQNVDIQNGRIVNVF